MTRSCDSAAEGARTQNQAAAHNFTISPPLSYAAICCLVPEISHQRGASSANAMLSLIAQRRQQIDRRPLARLSTAGNHNRRRNGSNGVIDLRRFDATPNPRVLRDGGATHYARAAGWRAGRLLPGEKIGRSAAGAGPGMAVTIRNRIGERPFSAYSAFS